MTQPHKLPAQLHESIYREIAHDYLRLAQPQEHPVAIITGGQPGSGKSGVTSRAKSELSGVGGFVLVDADEVRSRHPDFERLLRIDDTTAANKTHPDAGAWAGRLGREAIATKRNVIFDQTSKDPAAVADLAAKLQQAGYRVELRVMAVNPQVSEQRIHMRYESQKAAMGHGRFSTKDNHDIAFEGVLKAVTAVEAAKSVDAIRVYDKDHRAIYEAWIEAGQWSREPQAAMVMHAERSRPLDLAEKAELVTNYEAIAKMLGAPHRNATAPERATFAELADKALRQYLGHALRDGVDHPGLVQAQALLHRMGQQADASGMIGEARSWALTLGREIIARSLEQGEPLNKVAQDYLGAGLARPHKGPELDR